MCKGERGPTLAGMQCDYEQDDADQLGVVSTVELEDGWGAISPQFGDRDVPHGTQVYMMDDADGFASQSRHSALTSHAGPVCMTAIAMHTGIGPIVYTPMITR
jgi:hypothetical protein